MNQDKQKKSVTPIILGIIQAVIIFLFVGIALISFASKLPFLSSRGVTFYSVISGSMEPTIPTGSIIYSGRFQLEKLKKGDIITFAQKDNRVVTHRIDSVETNELAVTNPDKTQKRMIEYKFFTKGDANATPDMDFIYAGQILGLYQWHVAKLGYIASFTQTPLGFGLMILLPSVILIIWEIISVILYFRHRIEEKYRRQYEKT